MHALTIKSVLLLGASFVSLGLSGQAAAQTTTPEVGTPEDTTPPVEPTATEARDAAQGETVVVTGSRIRQPEFTSPDPVALIDPQTARREGKLDTAEMLQSSPIAAGSTQVTGAISSNFVTNGGPGAQTIDLRGLGANRTLVLLNGRRAGPAGTRGGVSSFDLNVLPQSIVQRVDILKTGASSIYGSDAIAGVVNILTRTDTKGLELTANVSVPTRLGGEQYRLSAMWGKTFSRGHVLVAADYFNQQELSRGDRDYLGCPEAYVTKPGSDERADLVDPRTGKYHCEDLRWGHLWTYDLERRFDIGPGNLFTTTGAYAGGLGTVALLQYQYPGEMLGIPGIDPTAGNVAPFTSPPGWFPTGYDPASTAVQNAYHPFVLEQTLIPSTKRYTVYADAAYELTDSIEAYAEFLGNRRKSYQNGWRQFWTFGYTGDLYGDGSYGTYWAQGFSGYNWISPTGITNHYDSSQKVDYWRGVTGLRGDLGFLNGWSYDAHVQYSRNKGRYRQEQFLQDVYDVSYFQTASCVGTVLPVSGKQCIDLPWTDPYFLAGQFSEEQTDFMFDWEEGVTKYKQLSGEASITGNLFELPAGPLGVALGVTARRDEIRDKPGEITLAGNAWGNTASGITAGYSLTKEAFGEVQVPLLKDVPFFRSLSLSGAARITNVKSVQDETGISDKDNGNWTYKVGGNWAVNPWLRFRGSFGTSFRAPALFEQFKANETSFANARNLDPCVQYAQNVALGNISQTIAANCAAQGIPDDYTGGAITSTIFSQGGIGVLDPETSKAKTASIILTPRFEFLPKTRFSLAIDYFDITVRDEVSQLGASNILLQCYESANFPNDPLCNLFTRGSGTDPYAVTEVQDKYINIAKQRNRGLDFTALIQHDLGALGSINLLSSVTRQLEQSFSLFADNEEDDLIGVIDLDGGTRTGTRKWAGDINLTWRAPNDLTIFYGVDFFSKASNAKEFRESNAGDLCVESTIRGDYCVDVSVPAVFYHAASITKEFYDRFDLTVGVSNLFDKKPPRVSTIGGIGIPALIGPVVGTSQYDLIGRRVFMNLGVRF